jgi:O-acetylhomoserine (thiol)-lyase
MRVMPPLALSRFRFIRLSPSTLTAPSTQRRRLILKAKGIATAEISNPTNAVLERRVAALEDGVEALSVSSGQTALHYATLNLTQTGTNIVSVPRLYGTTHTVFAHVLPSLGISVRFAESDPPQAIEKLIDRDTRAVFCESVGNPEGNIWDIAQ